MTSYTYTITVSVDDESGNATAVAASESANLSGSPSGSVEDACAWVARRIASDIEAFRFGI